MMAFGSRSRRLQSVWIPLAVMGLLSLSCSSDNGTSSSATSATATTSSACGAITPAPGGVATTEQDFSITLGSSSGPAGSTTFNIANLGPSVHEFVIFKTDLAPDALPLDSAGTAVDEEGAGVTHVDEVEDVAACSTDKSLTVDLEAGSYVLICNITSHYGLGMRAPFTVS